MSLLRAYFPGSSTTQTCMRKLTAPLPSPLPVPTACTRVADSDCNGLGRRLLPGHVGRRSSLLPILCLNRPPSVNSLTTDVRRAARLLTGRWFNRCAAGHASREALVRGTRLPPGWGFAGFGAPSPGDPMAARGAARSGDLPAVCRLHGRYERTSATIRYGHAHLSTGQM